jgi:hypothetical protein
VFDSQAKFQSEKVMADVFLAIAIAGAKYADRHGSGYRIRYHMEGRVRGQFTPSVGGLFHSTQLAS